MNYLWNASQMKQFDRDTIERIGIPSLVLMERAALAVVEELLRAKEALCSVLVVCGSGNNGADGFAAARLLRERNIPTEILFAGKDTSMTEECRIQRQICENCGIKIWRKFPENEYTLIVDAVFGIGLSRPISGSYEALIDRINQSAAMRAAVDIPSGISADDGSVMGTAVRADLTVTFEARKIGQILYPGTEYCGRLVCRNIGIHVPKSGSVFSLSSEDFCCLPKRPAYSNKGTFGKVLLIAGSEGMSGAACLGARAAYRTGCGLVRVFTAECNRQVIQTAVPEAVVTTYRTEQEAVQKLRDALEWADAVGIGPGLGMEECAEKLVAYTAEECRKPLVIDADGLNLLAVHRDLLDTLRMREIPVILTPHIGEMSRLTQTDRRGIVSHLIDSCSSFAGQYHLICVQKDARTVISDGERICINTTGNSGMAAGGSGDVLTGVISSLLAQGADPFDAAAAGACLHGLAGDSAAREIGPRGMMAGELADHVGRVLSRIDNDV